MAKREHLQKLRQGSEIWNKWREENPAVEPDLVRTNLRKANLSKTNLSGVDFFEANLRCANLRKANLRQANLIGTNLFEVDFYGANLFEANLHGADFSRANLREARFLTVEQLSKVRTLYKAKLDSGLRKQISQQYPHLLENPTRKVHQL